MNHSIYFLLFFISLMNTVYCLLFNIGKLNGILGRFLGRGEGTNIQNGCYVNNGGCEQGCFVEEFQVLCYCFPGFVLNRDQRTCSDINECSLESQNVCQDRCVNTLGSYFCTCTSGVLLNDGKSCSQGLLSCAENNGGCEQECTIQGYGDISCKCGKGFVLAEDQKSCYDIDECSRGKKCRPESTCINTVGGYKCSLDGISSCSVKNGGCDHTCKKTKRGIVCKCNKEFKLQSDFKTCRRVQEKCAVRNGGCDHICQNNGKGTNCLCRKGFQLHKNGKSCFLPTATPKPVDLCQNNNGGCDQICLSENGAVKCDCREGFEMADGKCLEPSVEAKPSPPVIPPPQRECGISRRKKFHRRIVGGKPIGPKDWPWMAAILQNNGRHICGGTLISDRHVLTAAHCFIQYTKNHIKVRLGEYDFDTSDENNQTDFGVQEIKSHENFDMVTFDNDIAIIKLDRTTSFTDFISPACLPPPNYKHENQSGFVIGWGKIKFGGPISNVLHEVLLPIWNQRECLASHPENRPTENMFCAGLKEGGKDACKGDSGGPFLVQSRSNTRWYVAGIVSWGIECANANRPGVYTKVNKYVDWIKSNAGF